MDFKYDSKSAYNLMKQMENSTLEMNRAVNEIKKAIEKGRWEDKKSFEFNQNMSDICSEISKTVKVEENYIKVLKKKMNELED